MSNSERTRTPRVDRVRAWLAAAAVLSFVLACAIRPAATDGPQHGWWSQKGPVVPHDDFPADCGLCHVEGRWDRLRDDFTYDHLAETGVALEGAHARAECLRCHNDRGPIEVFASRGCAGCHPDPHRGRSGTSCEDCHDERSWRAREAIAQHARTRFPLIGAHAATACWRCHPGAQVGEFSRTPVECETCHAADLAATTDPDHVALGWTTGCERCHIETQWTGSGFVHDGFPLTGAHATADCTACHDSGVFVGLPTDCADCHAAEYDATDDPDHAAAGFPLACELCHDTNAWEGAIFAHVGIVDGCAECHADDYGATTDPDHALAGFPLTCELCHGTQAWEGAVFSHLGIVDGCAECHVDDYDATTDPDHAAAGFPLACELCHDTNVWSRANFSHAGIVDGCAECHLDAYQATRQPNHAAAGFPLTCELCHGTASWGGATFDHAFPIVAGNHGGLDCADCHPRPSNFFTVTCVDCHAHTKADTDDDHDRVPGYVYSSPACLACHPDGNE